VKDFLGKSSLSFSSMPSIPGQPAVLTKVGDAEIRGWDEKQFKSVLASTGYPAKADPAAMDKGMLIVVLTILVVYVTMVYGPIAAMLVELFPTKIRYTSMSLPYHIGNGWFGGFLPPLAFAMVAAAGDIYYGLWYPIAIAVMTFVIGSLFLRDTKDRVLTD